MPTKMPIAGLCVCYADPPPHDLIHHDAGFLSCRFTLLAIFFLFVTAPLDHRPTSHDTAGAAAGGVAATLVTLHVAAHAKGFAAARMRALVRLLARVRVAVDPQAARSAKRLVARRAEVLVLALRVDAALGRVQVVVVLPQLLALRHWLLLLLVRREAVRQDLLLLLLSVVSNRLGRGQHHGVDRRTVVVIGRRCLWCHWL